MSQNWVQRLFNRLFHREAKNPAMPESKSQVVKSVAVFGAGGNLGQFVVEQLIQAEYRVTVIARPEGNYTASNPQVAVKKVEFGEGSLTAALAGQDAVVVVIGKGAAILSQKVIIDAAVKAGVKRFIPSEFGSNTLSEALLNNVPSMKDKATILKYLTEKSAAHKSFTWTGISNGAFLDWGLESNFLGFDLQNETANIYSSGNKPFHATRRATIGKAVVAALQSETAANKLLYVADVTTTQNELLALLEEHSGKKWTVTEQDTAKVKEDALERLSQKDFSAIGRLIIADLFGDGAGTVGVETLNNKLLGLPRITAREAVVEVLATA